MKWEMHILCICSLYSKNIFEIVKKIQTKISRVHLDRLRTHDQVSRLIDICSVMSKKDKEKSRANPYFTTEFCFFLPSPWEKSDFRETTCLTHRL
jgi:hypothetical protein